ncbi:uncharacterized protein LOC106168043 [Lingula anatina]|uniref:Uncharacterized protein LOC106168043 n=1 Tax=Lingula anatina TaxID=7574 RepID=A0A1S3IY00_LINAN|nr:uncharacterized protein LOC106168043 [Lingula anatina]|eukprot:XP_013402424.1 uncharacterized protein LOC106168043 [Lingula anatina]
MKIAIVFCLFFAVALSQAPTEKPTKPLGYECHDDSDCAPTACCRGNVHMQWSRNGRCSLKIREGKRCDPNAPKVDDEGRRFDCGCSVGMACSKVFYTGLFGAEYHVFECRNVTSS